MANPELPPPERKTLWVSETVHALVTDIQRRMRTRLGYKPSQSEVVRKAVEALEREEADR